MFIVISVKKVLLELIRNLEVFMKFKTWLNDWVLVYKKPYIKSWKNIKNVIRLHIPENIKSLELDKLNAYILQKAINDVDSSRMRLETFDVIHGSLSMAYKIGFLDKDLSSLLVKPKHVRKVGNALSPDELSKFLIDISGHRYEKYYKFLLYTGARRQEALDFSFTDIILESDLLVLKGTKTANSFRTVPVFPEVYNIFEFSSKEEFKTYLKKNVNVKPFRFSASRLSREFKILCPNHKLHDLRHTFATRCLECDISMKVVQGWLGHARLDTTASIYSHILPHFEKTEAQKFKLI